MSYPPHNLHADLPPPRSCFTQNGGGGGEVIYDAAFAGAADWLAVLLAQDPPAPPLDYRDAVRRLPVPQPPCPARPPVRLRLNSIFLPHCYPQSGRTALHVASWRGSLECVRLLLEAGAEADARADEGRTPLHFAVLNGFTDVARLLIEKGAADEGFVDKDGRNSLDLAQTSETLQMLMTAGVRLKLNLITSPRCNLPRSVCAPRRRLKRAFRRNSRQGWLPLHVAAHAGDEQRCRQLLAEGHDKDGTTANVRGASSFPTS